MATDRAWFFERQSARPCLGIRREVVIRAAFPDTLRCELWAHALIISASIVAANR